MERAEVFALSLHRWDFFGTLTFTQGGLSGRKRLALWFAFLRTYAKRLGVPFHSLYWCLRSERGELTGRRHFHYLLGHCPRWAVTKRGCFAQRSLWERERGGFDLGGHSRVYLFDNALNGVAYVAKCLNGESRLGASNFESAKFGDPSSELMLANALVDNLGATRWEQDPAALRGARPERDSVRDTISKKRQSACAKSSFGIAAK